MKKIKFLMLCASVLFASMLTGCANDGDGDGNGNGGASTAEINALVTDFDLPASVGNTNPFASFFGEKISHGNDDEGITYEFTANEVTVTETFNEGHETWSWVKKYSYTYNTVIKRIFLKLKYEKYIDQEKTCEGSSAGEFINNGIKIGGNLTEYMKYNYISDFSSGLSYKYEIESNTVTLKSFFENPLLSRNAIQGKGSSNSFYLDYYHNDGDFEIHYEALILGCEGNKISGKIMKNTYSSETDDETGKCVGDFTATYTYIPSEDEYWSQDTMKVNFLTYPNGLEEICTETTVYLENEEITLTLEN